MKLIEDIASSVIESNEIPYIFPRIIIGGFLVGSVVLLVQPSFDLIPQIPYVSFAVFVMALLAGWLIGYFFDSLSLLVLRAMTKFETSDFNFFYKSGAGYRLLLIFSINIATVTYLLISGFCYVVRPKFDAGVTFGFPFWLSIFIAGVLLAVTGLYLIVVVRKIRPDIDSYRHARLHDIEQKVKAQVEKEIEGLKRKITELSSMPNGQLEAFRAAIAERDVAIQQLQEQQRTREIEMYTATAELLERSNRYLDDTVAQKQRVLTLQEQLIDRSAT